MKEFEDISHESKMFIGAIWNPMKNLYISPNIIDTDNSSEEEVRLTFMFKY